jgi:hypothetical protein
MQTNPDEPQCLNGYSIGMRLSQHATTLLEAALVVAHCQPNLISDTLRDISIWEAGMFLVIPYSKQWILAQ